METVDQEKVFNVEHIIQQKSLHKDTVDQHLNYFHTDTGIFKWQNITLSLSYYELSEETIK